MAQDEGLPVLEISRRLSLPKSTLMNWVRVSKTGDLDHIGKVQRPLTEIERGLAKVKRELALAKVVTEYGAANLFGKNIQERAMAMISAAHPDFRDQLFEQARRVGMIGQERKLNESRFGVYPAWLEEVMTIAGQKVTLRPVKTVDDRLIQEHFYEMDEKDIAKRFFGRKHHFYWDKMKDMFIVDYANNCSIVAYLGEEGYGRIIGIGGYFLEGNGVGEVAYSVARDWQGKGIAVRLQQKVVDAARAGGLTGLEAVVLKDNFSILALFKKLPYQIRTGYEDDMLTLKCRFDEPA